MKKNFKQLKVFQAKLNALNQDKDLFIEQVTNDLAGIFLREVILRTPHKSGHLQDTWRIGEIIKVKDGYMVSIINNTEYASYVENGHRQQVGRYVPVLGKRLKANFVEGKHMMKLSAEYIEKEGEKYIQQKLNEFLKRHLHG